MSENEIEMLSTLTIWFIGGWFVGSTVGWYAFLYGFRLFDNYLQERNFRKKGFVKEIDEHGKTWYVGYGWPYDN